MKTVEISLIFLLLTSCERKQSNSKEKIEGIYVRETSFEVNHLETDKYVGRSTLRDTLFIQANGQGFLVSQ